MSILLAILTAFLTPCVYEGDTMCYWDASTNGGYSFISITDDFVVYLINLDN